MIPPYYQGDNMRAEIVHVTDHALRRWRERAAEHANEGVHKIIEAVKSSRVLKKKELLPYPMPRLPYSVYSVKDDILFILESVSIDEYRLVTVITKEMTNRVTPKKKKKKEVVTETKEVKEILVFPKKPKLPKKVVAVTPKPKKTVAERLAEEEAAKTKNMMYYKPPIILTVSEESLVRQAEMDVAVKLGLVVNL